jgi:hypothetical protein
MEIMANTKEGVVQLPCIFPREIENLKQSFEKFYLDKHSGRKLSWQAGMGTADIRATFKRSNGKIQKHELNVSTYMMVILLLFNDLPDGESLSFAEIEERTRIPKNDLIRNLQSLALVAKTRVLRKSPMSKEINPTDRFTFNHEFQSPFVKVRIGVVAGAKVEDQEQRKETEKKMADERGGSIEAAIVRIMKYVIVFCKFETNFLTVYFQATEEAHTFSTNDRGPHSTLYPLRSRRLHGQETDRKSHRSRVPGASLRGATNLWLRCLSWLFETPATIFHLLSFVSPSAGTSIGHCNSRHFSS